MNDWRNAKTQAVMLHGYIEETLERMGGNCVQCCFKLTVGDEKKLSKHYTIGRMPFGYIEFTRKLAQKKGGVLVG